jgi:beta-N-acetylhexosaminidase
VLPTIKHIPGHGRARVDSHKDLPLVDTPAAVLRATDFAPFRALNDIPWAMTAHVVYSAIDPGRPATLSRRVIDTVIRGEIGFDGVLVSDDVNMGALAGTMRERVAGVLAAGCDAALHCSGILSEMREAAEAASLLTPTSMARIGCGEGLRRGSTREFDRREAEARFDVVTKALAA